MRLAFCVGAVWGLTPVLICPPCRNCCLCWALHLVPSCSLPPLPCPQIFTPQGEGVIQTSCPATDVSTVLRAFLAETCTCVLSTPSVQTSKIGMFLVYRCHRQNDAAANTFIRQHVHPNFSLPRQQADTLRGVGCTSTVEVRYPAGTTLTLNPLTARPLACSLAAGGGTVQQGPEAATATITLTPHTNHTAGSNEDRRFFPVCQVRLGEA